ncbi:MAG: ATPase, T2SS/T4P/T4SS family [Alphaproteobacteria bacterium]
MFGKKSSNSASVKSAPKAASKSAAPLEAPVKKIETEKIREASAALEAKPEALLQADDGGGNEMLAGLNEAIAATPEDKPEVKLEEKPKAKPAPQKKEAVTAKEEKPAAGQADDPFAEDLAGMEEEAAEEKASAHSITTLRLQRARNRIWLDLRDGIDLKALANMESKAAREEVLSAVEEIARFRNLDLTPAELQSISKECADDMLGFGPLEELLERDDIADIMINGPETTYIEVGGKIQKTKVKFRDNQHLTTICQRIVGAIGRRVDEASPICDARLSDGSRVNVIIPPLAVDGACMTIRKFTKDKLTLEKLQEFGSMTPSCAQLIKAIGRCRVNVLVSGGTGSGKTTMLNCLTRYIEPGERIITCEDACELQLQQPHVVRLETRPPNLEGVGEVTMRDLVKNCLRMRPERIIVGEVRGPEAFDLLQAMNTGHDGSMGTVHANNPREALSRMENMIAMGGLNLPQQAVREQIAGAVNVIIQVQRLRDGSRKTTHVTEITGMEGEVVTMQDLFVLEIAGEDENGKLITRQKSTGLRPKFFDQARQFGVHQMVLDALEGAFD